jgi:ABC-type glycerol-3-phosphate transport system permease component
VELAATRPVARRRRAPLFSLAAHATLWLLGSVMVLPFLWMVSTSLKTLGETTIYPPEWIPSQVMWGNYLDVVRSYPFGLFALNSVRVALLATAGELVSSTVAAYAFARMSFPGRNLLFMLLMATLMVPSQVTMIPTFLLFNQVGWVNTYLPLIVPYWCAPAFGTFLMRQFFLTIPREYNDAASIDGASTLRILASIYVPLAKPALATLALFVFLGRWNDFLMPIIYLNEQKLMTLPVGLAYFRQQYVTLYHYLMAGSVMSIVPILVLFVVLQKYFVRGFVMSGLKG